MKVWKFYTIPNNNIRNSPELYAITSNKEYADNFKSIRDMSRFKEVKSDMDKEEYVELINGVRDQYLDKFTINTSIPNKKGIIKNEEISIILTTYEYLSVKEEYENILCEFDGMNWYYIYDFNIFNNKMKDALYTLGYYYIFNIFNVHMEEPPDDGIYDNYKEFDQYELLLRLFGHTFK